ncbi:SDR family NAD(P)-dependent oxidoreductase [Massilia sp. H6]|nr:SDR family NAD(P)-dependent oxidoreductase [Massilia sp. H6]UVW27832.1 SDR family NAD(P)-dependent oxidoreductase [Massilia sp. H6]
MPEIPGRSHPASAVARAIADAGSEAMDIMLDVRSQIAIPHVIDEPLHRFGRLDILVNSAGTQVYKPALEITAEEFDDVLDINLRGAFLCAQAVAPIMREQARGCIVNVSSQHGVVGNRMRAPSNGRDTGSA